MSSASGRLATEYCYLILDVFTDEVFGGNQLAVIPDARGLSTEQMQAIAREFNFAESTFVLPPESAETRHRLRIFTPKTELRFAGHPTVGTAAALAKLGRLPLQDGIGQVVFEEGVGPVTVDIDARRSPIFCRLTLPGEVEQPDEKPDLDSVAMCLSLPRRALLECWNASVGIPFCLVHLVDAQAVDDAALDRGEWNARLRDRWAPQLFMFAGDLRDGGSVYARMFAPGFGIDEDPATGSAAATLLGCLATRSAATDCSISLSINQGVALGRPSLIEASAEKRGGRVTSVSVGGRSAIFASGTLNVPG